MSGAFKGLIRQIRKSTDDSAAVVAGCKQLCGWAERNDVPSDLVSKCLRTLLPFIERPQSIATHLAALKATGVVLRQEKAAAALTPARAKRLLSVVTMGLEQRQSVQLLYHALWFLNVTKIPCNILVLIDAEIAQTASESSDRTSASTGSERIVASKDAGKRIDGVLPEASVGLLDRILVNLLAAIDDYATGDDSELHVATEAFQVIKKLIKELPEEMRARSCVTDASKLDMALEKSRGEANFVSPITEEGWISICIENLVGRDALLSAEAQSVITAGLPILTSQRRQGSGIEDGQLDPVVELLGYVTRRHLESRGKIAAVVAALKNPLNGPSRREVIQIWGYLVALLGVRQLFGSDKKLLNKMLEICQTAFIHPHAEIRLQAFDAWRYLVWTIACDVSKLVTTKNRLQLILAPLNRGIVKEQNVDIRKACYSTWAQLVNLLGHRQHDGCSVIFSVFDLAIKPFVTETVTSPRSTKWSPDLVQYALELLATLLEENATREPLPPSIEETALSCEDQPPLPPPTLVMPEEFIHEQLQFFLFVLAHSFNHPRKDVYQQNSRAYLLSIWNSLVARVMAALATSASSKAPNVKEMRERAMLSLKALLSFPFTSEGNEQGFGVDKWDIGLREEFLNGLLTTASPRLLTSSKFRLSLIKSQAAGSPQQRGVPIIVFLIQCWIKSVKDGLCHMLEEESQLASQGGANPFRDTLIPRTPAPAFHNAISSSMVAQSQIGTYGNMLEMMKKHIPCDSIFEYFGAILQRLHDKNTSSLVCLADVVPLWAMLATKVAEYVTESNHVNKSKRGTTAPVHETLLSLLAFVFGPELKGIDELPAIDRQEVTKGWTKLFISVQNVVAVKQQQTLGQVVNILALSHMLPEMQKCECVPVTISSTALHLLIKALAQDLAEIVSRGRAERRRMPRPERGDGSESSREGAESSSLDVISERIEGVGRLLAFVLLDAHRRTAEVGVPEATASTLASQTSANLKEAANFFRCCAEHCGDVSVLRRVLVLLQEPVAVWLRNPKPRGAVTAGEAGAMRAAVEAMWDALCLVLTRTIAGKRSQELLSLLSPLLQTVLSSNIRWLKSSAIELWNSTFADTSEDLQCTPSLSAALNKLQPHCDIRVPKWAASSASQILPSETPSFPDESFSMAITPNAAAVSFSNAGGGRKGMRLPSIKMAAQVTAEKEEKCPPTLPSGDDGDSEPSSSSFELSPHHGRSPAKNQLPSLSPSASPSVAPTVLLTNSEKSTVSETSTLSGSKRSAPDSLAELKANSLSSHVAKASSVTAVRVEKESIAGELLTEKQKEVRREQHKKAKLFDYDAPTGSLTTQDIEDELYGSKEDAEMSDAPALAMERSLPSFNLDASGALTSVDFMTPAQYLGLLEKLASSTLLVDQLSEGEVITAQRHVSSLLHLMIEVLGEKKKRLRK